MSWQRVILYLGIGILFVAYMIVLRIADDNRRVTAAILTCTEKCAADAECIRACKDAFGEVTRCDRSSK